MKEWRQTIAFICTVVATLVTLATLMQSQFASMRADHADIRTEMRAGFDTIRTQMRDEHTALRGEHTDMRGEHVDIRMEMRAGLDTVRAQARTDHAATLNQLATIRDQLTSVDRRTARIEGHLFGIEVAPEPTDGE